jgi:hypothetical protein
MFVYQQNPEGCSEWCMKLGLIITGKHDEGAVWMYFLPED